MAKLSKFGAAFKAARAAGKSTFSFGGKEYTTQTKEEAAAPRKTAPKSAPKPEPRGDTKPSSPSSRGGNAVAGKPSSPASRGGNAVAGKPSSPSSRPNNRPAPEKKPAKPVAKRNVGTPSRRNNPGDRKGKPK